MSGLNKVLIIGNLGKDPEQFGAAVKFTLATSEKWKDNSGQEVSRTEWHNCVAFGKLGEICMQYLQKGGQVYVEGSLRTSQWESDGVKKSKTEIIVSQMQMLGGKQQEAKPKPQQQSMGAMDDDSEIPF